MFKRKIYEKMLDWKQKSDGRTALLIEGARRVGKSTVVEEFARREYRSYILIDFSIADSSIAEMFDHVSDLNYFFLRLQLLYNKQLFERESCIIFDEVQFCPKARQAIKVLVKDHRYDYIETGSLISIRRNIKDILIPSEEEKLQMFPMDYEEFLSARGNTSTYELLRLSFQEQKSLGDKLHRQLMRDFRLYMLIGGMPQAVDEYLRLNNLHMVDRVKRNILSLYEDDFMKIDPTGKISMLFDAIPAELHKNASRYQVSSVLSNDRSGSILEMLAEMRDSKTVLVSYHANDPNIGLASNKDLERFKLFLADTGLFVTLVFKDKDFTENEIYEKLLSDKLRVNLGYVYENVVAQMLAVKGELLYYHTFLNQKSRHNYEVDFLLSRKNKIVPIEVKSSGYTTHASLDAFTQKFSDRIGQRYVVYTKDLKKEKDILYIPMYMVPFV